MESDWANLAGSIHTTLDLKTLASQLEMTGPKVAVATRICDMPYRPRRSALANWTMPGRGDKTGVSGCGGSPVVHCVRVMPFLRGS